jgi:hypothetical protein
MSGGNTQETVKKNFLYTVMENSDKRKRLQRKKIYVKKKGVCSVRFLQENKEEKENQREGC